MDPDPGGRAGGGRGRRRERREGIRAVLRLLFLGEGDEGALASSSPISRRCHDGSYKQLNINMTLINSLPLFIRTLTSAARR